MVEVTNDSGKATRATATTTQATDSATVAQATATQETGSATEALCLSWRCSLLHLPADSYGPLGPVEVTLTGVVSSVCDLGWGALAVSLKRQPVESLTRRGSTAASGRQLNIETGAREAGLLAPSVENLC